MGHSRRSLPVPQNAHCCTRHIDTRLPRKACTPVVGIANVFDNQSRPRLERDSETVQRRRAARAEARRLERRARRLKEIESKIHENPKVMAARFLEFEERHDRQQSEGSVLQDNIDCLKSKLERQAPSKLSTLTDHWVKSFTPFRNKVTLLAFLLKMVLPNMEYAWFVVNSCLACNHTSGTIH